MTDDAAFADEILGYLPAGIRHRSGSMLMSGRKAWTGTRPLYVLGFNPGGEPREVDGTIAGQAQYVLERENYSSYTDEEWEVRGKKYAAGAAPLQRSVRHVLGGLGLAPDEVPSTNLNFVRSATVADLGVDDGGWAEECWPFHSAMVERLGVRVVLCFGEDTAIFVRAKVGSHVETDRFVENNARRWASVTYSGGSVTVIAAAHPGRSYWYLPHYDIAPLVARALAAPRTT